MNVSSLHEFQRCRLCALPISTNSLIPFFDTIYEPMIRKLTSFGLKIRRDDGLPESICHGCTGILTTFTETMELFMEADKKLKKLLEYSKQSNAENNSGSKLSKANNEDQKNKGSKRKTEDDDIEIIETKKAKRRDCLNLLRKSRTSLLNDSKNEEEVRNDQKTEPLVKEKNKEVNEEIGMRKKQERKDNLQAKVRRDSIKNTSQLQDMTETNKTDCNFEFMNIENHDHNYGIVKNSINNLGVKGEIEVSEGSDFETQNKSQPSKNVKLITLEKMGIRGKLPANLPSPSNPLPAVYIQPSDDKDVDVFTCLECSQIFWNRKETLEHIYKEHAKGALTYKARYMVKRVKNTKAYNSRNQIVCLLCHFTVDDTYSYFEHLTGHYMSIFKCVHCYYNFSSKDALQKHKMAHRHDIMTCKICDQQMPLEYYNAHERSHSLNAQFQKRTEVQLVINKTKSKSYGQTNDNINQEVNKVDFQYIIPRRKEEDAMKNEVPEETEITVKEEMEKILQSSFVVNENSSNDIPQPEEILEEHRTDEDIQEIYPDQIKVEIAKEKPIVYKCSTCQRTLKERSTILRHMQKVHPTIWANKKSPFKVIKLEIDEDETDSKEIYMCGICTIDFDTESKHSIHLETHHSCKYCHKTFYHKEEVKLHQRSHEKPYRCDICDASFYVEKNYIDHKLTHTHQCDFCKASYRTEESLMNHKKIVHPKVSCPICSQGFENKELLNKHEATHTKKKTPSLCELCGKSYSNTTRFNCHMLTHSKDNEFNCKFCPVSFKTAAKLRKHHRFSHLVDYTESLRENVN